MSASGTDVLYEVKEGVGCMTLNRPDKFNCISTGLMNGVDAAMDAFEADNTVRVVLLTGAGKTFCTGADLDEVMAARQNKDELRNFIGHIHCMLRRFEASSLPIVVAINGLTLAGGIEIMMACDVAFAGRNKAKIGDQHAQYGLIPGGGGTQRLPRLVGLRRALDLMFTNRWLDAREAEKWGLVNYVVEDEALADESFTYCQNLAKKSRAGLSAMKQWSRQGLEGSLSDGLTMEEELVVDGLLGPDVEEGLAAFQDRRVPNFG